MSYLLLAATYIATAFFGPNAFPVPAPLNGRVQESLHIEVAADGYWSTSCFGETADLFLSAEVPLFTKYANLSLWMPVQEWYNWPQKGHGTGDVYISTNIQLLTGSFRCFQEKKCEKYIPDVALRVGLKTASGGQSELKRHFDDPGYWFDLSAGYSFYHGPMEYRLSGTAGFLCWQTTTSRQNDAFYYGLTAEVKHTYVGIRVGWQGYSGWEIGDKPMTIQAKLSGYAKGFEPFISYQYGIRDFPYHQLRVGLAYNLNILKK